MSETLRSYADSYNEVSAAAANQKFGHDVSKECEELARSGNFKSLKIERAVILVPTFTIMFIRTSVKPGRKRRRFLDFLRDKSLLGIYPLR